MGLDFIEFVVLSIFMILGLAGWFMYFMMRKVFFEYVENTSEKTWNQ